MHARPAHVRGPRLAQHGPLEPLPPSPGKAVEVGGREKVRDGGRPNVLGSLQTDPQDNDLSSPPPAAHDTHLSPNMDTRTPKWTTGLTHNTGGLATQMPRRPLLPPVEDRVDGRSTTAAA